MSSADGRFIKKDALIWRALYHIMAAFVTKRVVANSPQGRSRKQITSDIVNDGVGRNASISGRDHNIGMLTYSLVVGFAAVYGLLLAVAMAVRPALGNVVAGNLLAVASAALFPLLGPVFPLSWRFALAVWHSVH